MTPPDAVQRAHDQSYERLSDMLATSPVDRFVRFWNLGYRDVEVGRGATAGASSTADGSAVLATPERSARFNADGLRLVGELCKGVSLAGRRLIDVGCGRGGASVMARAAGAASVVSLDRSPSAAKFCRRSDLAVVRGDCQRLPFADKCADVVLNLESSQFYERPDEFFAECARVLDDGGMFLYGDSFPVELVGPTVNVLRSAGFVVETRRDVTANVLESRRAVGAAQARALGGDPFLANFAGAPGGRIFADLEENRYSYLLFGLRKGAEPGMSDPTASDIALVRTFARRSLFATTADFPTTVSR